VSLAGLTPSNLHSAGYTLFYGLGKGLPFIITNGPSRHLGCGVRIEIILSFVAQGYQGIAL
jgi:hypothetical protein